jgi:SulP family sulfate permease
VTDKINAITDHLSSLPPMVILRLRNMTAIRCDRQRSTGRTGGSVAKKRSVHATVRERPQPEALMREAGFDRLVGSENICENTTEALKRAEGDL